jgi:hypothetical protein
MAVIYALLRGTKNSVRIIAKLLHIPSSISINLLRYHPDFDLIRDTAEFLPLLAADN